MTAGTRSRALELLHSPEFFREMLAALQRSGLVGEERNALVTYVVATSRLLPEPLALFIKGPSSVGKNFLADRVLDLIPPSEVQKFTASSEKSWNYQGTSLQHKILYLKERYQGAGPTHPLRLLISEKQLEYFVTIRDKNEWSVRKVVAEGPIAAVSTTTRERVEVDDETRHISIWMDESPQQTDRILDAAVERELEDRLPFGTADLKQWHEVQRLLEARAQLPIRFPKWLKRVASCVDTTSIWVRRYFPAFLRAVKTITLIRSFQLTRAALATTDYIPVQFSDLAIANLIFGSVFSESLGRAEDTDSEVRQCISEISKRTGATAVGASELSRTMGISMDRTYALIRKAVRAGTIYQATKPMKGNRKLYLPSERNGFLPSPEEILQTLTDGPNCVDFIHPLTGEHVVLRGRSRWSEEAE